MMKPDGREDFERTRTIGDGRRGGGGRWRNKPKEEHKTERNSAPKKGRNKYSKKEQKPTSREKEKGKKRRQKTDDAKEAVGKKKREADKGAGEGEGETGSVASSLIRRQRSGGCSQ